MVPPSVETAFENKIAHLVGYGAQIGQLKGLYESRRAMRL